MTNVGHSPAVDASIFATVYTTTAERNHPLIEQKKICDPVRSLKKPPHPYDFGEIIFPGATAYSKQVLSLPKSEIERCFAYPDHHWFDVTLVGCADYRFTFEGDHHQTGFIREVRKESNEKPGHFVTFNFDEGNVPSTKLRFQRAPYGSYAD